MEREGYENNRTAKIEKMIYLGTVTSAYTNWELKTCFSLLHVKLFLYYVFLNRSSGQPTWYRLIGGQDEGNCLILCLVVRDGLTTSKRYRSWYEYHKSPVFPSFYFNLKAPPRNYRSISVYPSLLKINLTNCSHRERLQ